MEMDLNETLERMVEKRPKEWRRGQAYFNYAYEMFPEVVDEIRGTDRDCFYRNDRIGIFLEELNSKLFRNI